MRPLINFLRRVKFYTCGSTVHLVRFVRAVRREERRAKAFSVEGRLAPYRGGARPLQDLRGQAAGEKQRAPNDSHAAHTRPAPERRPEPRGLVNTAGLRDGSPKKPRGAK